MNLLILLGGLFVLSLISVAAVAAVMALIRNVLEEADGGWRG